MFSPIHDRQEVAIVQRTRLGQLLVALGLVVATVSGLGLAFGAVAQSSSIAVDAGPRLVEVDVIREPIEVEFARSVVAVLPPGSMNEATATAVADRMVRDSMLVDALADAAGVAHEGWQDGAEFVLVLDPSVTTPAAISALRDIDLELSRDLSDQFRVVTSPIVLPVTTASEGRIDQIIGLCQVGLLVGLVVLGVGAVLDPHRDRSIRATSTALLILGGVLILAPLVAKVPDLTSWGWWTASSVAAIDAAAVSLAIGGAISLALGAFLWAVASQAAPSVSARIERRERDAVTPPPAPTGAHTSRRRGKKVRQQGNDAFFGPEDDEADEETDDANVPDEELVPVAQAHEASDGGDARPLPRPATGFDQAVDAVQAQPAGPVDDATSAPDDEDEGADGPGDDSTGAAKDRPRGMSDAERMSRERREALERIDGRRGRVRTHLPR